MAGLGLGGVALVSTCILTAGERYTGLMVRPKHKRYGTRRMIEGALHPGSKVVVVVDSIDTGRSFLDAARALEARAIVRAWSA